MEIEMPRITRNEAIPERAFLIEGDKPDKLIFWLVPSWEKHSYFGDICHFHQEPYLGVLYSLMFKDMTPNRKLVLSICEAILQGELNYEKITA